jgi:hypothetical protein
MDWNEINMLMDWNEINMLMDWNEINNLNTGPSIDASYQVRFILPSNFRGEDF